MISWRFSILIAVVFCSKVAFSCYSDSDCPGYGETCCSDDICRSDCSSDGGVSTVIVIIIVIFVVCFKIVFWVAICYCRQRRGYGGITFTRFNNAPTTVVVNASNTTQVHDTNSQGNIPVQQGYSPPQQMYPSQQQGYNLPQQGYKPSQQRHEMVNPVSNPPPPYTENPQS